MILGLKKNLQDYISKVCVQVRSVQWHGYIGILGLVTFSPILPWIKTST